MEEKKILELHQLLVGIDTVAEDEAIEALKWAIDELEKIYCNEDENEEILNFVKVSTYPKGTEVMPCPFCGEKEKIYYEQYETKVGARWRIACVECMAQIDRGYDQIPQPLVELWNRRK